MVYRRRTYRRRGTRRPTRRFAARTRRTRPTRALRSTNVHNFIRWASAGTPEIISCDFPASGVSAAALTFQLSNVINHAEFTALYDSYRILGARVYFDYSPDIQAVGPGSNMGSHAYPKLWVMRDYDDATAVTIDLMNESNRSKCLRFNDSRTTLSMYVRPAAQQMMYEGVATTAYSPKWRPWIDCANDDVPHYGLKVVAQGIPSMDLGAITVRIKYYLQFKNPQ